MRYNYFMAGTLYTYNLAGWNTEKREPVETKDGGYLYKLTTFAYDDCGLCIRETRYRDLQTEESRQGRTHTIHYTYDRSNRLTQVSDSTGAEICYAYDMNNKVTVHTGFSIYC